MPSVDEYLGRQKLFTENIDQLKKLSSPAFAPIEIKHDRPRIFIIILIVLNLIISVVVLKSVIEIDTNLKTAIDILIKNASN